MTKWSVWNVLRWSGFRVLLVIKPAFIAVFLIGFNLLGFLLILANHGTGRITDKKSAVLVVLMGVYMMFFALMPLVSKEYRKLCCRDGVEFERGIVGLMQITFVGILFCIYGVYLLKI